MAALKITRDWPSTASTSSAREKAHDAKADFCVPVFSGDIHSRWRHSAVGVRRPLHSTGFGLTARRASEVFRNTGEDPATIALGSIVRAASTRISAFRRSELS